MRKIILIGLLTCSMLVFGSCNANKTISNGEHSENDTNISAADRFAPDKPEDFALDFWIAENVEEVDLSKYQENYGWYGAREYLGSAYKMVIDEDGSQHLPEKYVSYLVSAYPDYSDGGKYITRIEIRDPEVKIYGLSINSSLEEFDELFKSMGYEISEVGSTGKCHKAEKEGIWFSLFEGLNLNVNAEVENREGIIF